MNISGIALKSDEEQQKEAERQLKFIDEAREIVESISKEIGRPLISVTETFGCEMNLAPVMCFVYGN